MTSLMKDPTYISWQRMKQRCVRNLSYRLKGITWDKRWDSFKNFLADMGPRPLGTTLEREDNDENYGPLNCKWATHKQQARNRSDNKTYLFRGKFRTVPEISELSGVPKTAIYQRLAKGWDTERAFTLPSNRGNRT